MFSRLTNLNIISFLVLLFPIALVSGPLIPEIIIFFLLLSILFKIFKKKHFIYFNSNIKKFFVIFLIFLIFSSVLAFINYENFYSFKNSIFYFRYGVLVYSIVYVLENNPNIIKYFYAIYSILFFILFLDELKQVITGVNFFNMKLEANRASSFFGSELVLDSFLMKMFPIFLAICFFLKKNHLIILAFVFLYGIAIFFGGSRSSFFSYLLFIFFFSFIFVKSRFYVFLFLFSIFLLSIFGLNTTLQGDRIWSSTIGQIFEKNKSPVIFSIRHQAHYETALNIFKSNLFFGSGPNQFRYLCGKNEFAPINTLNFKFVYAPIDPKVQIYLIDLDGRKIFVDLSSFAKKNKNDLKFEGKNLINNILSKSSIIEPNDYNKKYKIIVNISSNKLLDFSKNYTLSENDFFYLSDKYFKNDKIIEFSQSIFEFENGCNTHPHNFHIQLLSEIGIFGYSIVVFFLVTIVKCLYKNFVNRKKVLFYNEQYILMIGILTNFFPLTPSGNFFNNWLSFLLFMPIGFVIYFNKLYKK